MTEWQQAARVLATLVAAALRCYNETGRPEWLVAYRHLVGAVQALELLARLNLTS